MTNSERRLLEEILALLPDKDAVLASGTPFKENQIYAKGYDAGVAKCKDIINFQLHAVEENQDEA